MDTAAVGAMHGGTLFRNLLPDSFDALPAPVRAIHDKPHGVYHGRCDIERGRGLLSKLMAAVSGLPDAGLARALSVTIESGADGEKWTRDFGGRRMRSSLRQQGALLEERLGPTCFRFRFVPGAEGIDWKLESVRSLGIPLPLRWFKGVSARESADGNRYRFDVRAEMPLAGLLVHYRGYLDVA